MANKRYGLLLSSGKKQSSLKQSNVFGNDSSDEEDSIQKVNSSLAKSSNSWTTKETRDAINKALTEDPNVFEYDAIYDDMSIAKISADPKVKNQVDRKPKYIASLKKSAEQRKKEQEIIFERKMKKEVDQDKNLFEDKDAFVTPSYRKVLEERKAEEERLRKKDELEASVENRDMNLFYRNLLSSRLGQSTSLPLSTRPAATLSTRPAATLSTRPAATLSTESSTDHKSQSKEGEISDNASPTEVGTEHLNLSETDKDGNQEHREIPIEKENTQENREIPTGDEDKEEDCEIPSSLPLDSHQQNSPPALKRKRQAEKRNDDSLVKAARERYLARKKTKLN